MSSSFAKMARLAASTKRSGAPDADKHETAFAVSIAALKCIPLSTVEPELAQGLDFGPWYELLKTTVQGGLDIKEGDLLVVGAEEYPIRSVASYYWPPDGTERMVLILQDRKP